MVSKLLSNIASRVRNVFDRETAERLEELRQQSFLKPTEGKCLELKTGQRMKLIFTVDELEGMSDLVGWLEGLRRTNTTMPFKNAGFDLRIKGIYIDDNGLVVEGEIVK